VLSVYTNSENALASGVDSSLNKYAVIPDERGPERVSSRGWRAKNLLFLALISDANFRLRTRERRGFTFIVAGGSV